MQNCLVFIKPLFSTFCYRRCFYVHIFQVTLNNHFIGNPHYEVVRTDYVFSHYDKNEDKLISVEEFAKAEQISIDESLEVFTFADVNGMVENHRW